MIDKLTERESQVIALMAEGLSNKQIGSRLGLAEHTAKFHVRNTCTKLGVTTRTEAAVMYATAKSYEEGFRDGLAKAAAPVMGGAA
jgi:DNA-binding NarL/FixJ family response regulator